MSRILKLSSVFIAVLAVAQLVPAATGKKAAGKSVKAAITEMEMAQAKADLAGDASWAKQNMTEDYTGGTSWGAWQTKKEILDNFADTKNNKSTKFDISDIKVRVYGNTTAVATSRQSYDSMIKGEHRSRTILTTSTWVNRNGSWKLAASHSSQADQKIGD